MNLRKKCWLSKQIEEKIGLKENSFKKRLKEFFYQSTYLSRQAILCGILGSTVITSVSSILSKIIQPYLIFPFKSISSFLPVTASFGAVLFGMLTLLIRFTRNTEGLAKSTKEVLTKETNIISIFYFYLCNLFFLTYSDFLGISVLSQSIIFIFTVLSIGYAYYQFFLLLFFYPSLLKKQSINQFKKKVFFSMINTLKKRIGQNLFYKFLEDKNQFISYYPFSYEKEKYIPLTLPKSGRIVDIEMCKLEKFISEIPKEEGKESIFSENVREIEYEDKEKKEPLICITRLFGEELPENKVLILVNKKGIKEYYKRKLEKEIKEIFKVEEEKVDELTEEMEHSRKVLKKSSLQKREYIIEDILEILREGIKTFIEELRKLNIQYNRELAAKELSNIEGGWKEISTFYKNFREIINEAFLFPHPEVLEKVVDFPYLVSHDALEGKNYYVFLESLEITSYIYKKILDLKDENLHRSLVRNLCIIWKEFGNISIGLEIKKDREEKQPEILIDFAIGLFYLFSNLLKISFDFRQDDDFNKFKESLLSLYLEFYLPSEIREKIQPYRELVLWGIGSWIIKNYYENKIPFDEFKNYFSSIAEFFKDKKLKDFTLLFYQSLKEEIENLFKWDWWITPEKEGEFWINPAEFSTRFYCVMMLVLINKIEKIENISLPVERNTIYLIEGENSQLMKVLNEIEKNKEKWENLIEVNIEENIYKFKKILEKTLADYKSRKRKEIIKAKLDESKVEKFKTIIRREWRKNCTGRKLIEKYGNFHTEEEKVRNQVNKALGYNLLLEKEFFIKETNIDITILGTQMGQGIAESENKYLVDVLGKSKEENTTKVNASDFKYPEKIIDILDSHLKKFENEGYNPLILIVNSWLMETAIKQSYEFKDVSQKDSFLLIGKYKSVPVINFGHFSKESFLVLVDFKKLGEWQQIIPAKDSEGEIIKNYFYFYLQPFDEERAKNLIRIQPDLLKDKKTGREKREEEVIENLLLKVHFKFFEKFEFIVKDENAVKKIVIENGY